MDAPASGLRYRLTQLSTLSFGDAEIAVGLLVLIGLVLLLAFPWGIYVFIPLAVWAAWVFVSELRGIRRAVRRR